MPDTVAPKEQTRTFNLEPETMRFGEDEVFIGPMKVGKLFDFAKAIKPVFPQIVVMAEAGKFDLATSLIEVGPQLVSGLAIAVSKDEDWVRELEAIDFITLATKVFLVNTEYLIKLIPDIATILKAGVKLIDKSMP